MQENYNTIFNKIMNQVSDVITQCLNEVYGIKEYGNEKYDKEISNIAEDIIQHFTQPLIYNATLLENDEQICQLMQLNYDIKSIDWLNTLHVYLTTNSVISDDNDTMIVTDRVYVYNDQKLKNKIVSSIFRFQIIDENYEIIEPFIVYDNQVKHASILITIPDIEKIYKQDELEYILKHELSHIYDMVSNKLTNKEINSDLMELDSYLQLSEKANMIIRKLLDRDATIKMKKQLIKEHIDENILNNIFVNNIYLLNKSEMRARLHNCIYEIKKNIDMLKSKFMNYEIKQDRLREISKQFNTYYILYELFSMIIKYTSNDIKDKFANMFLKNQFGKIRPDNFEPKYPYNKSFKNNKNQYDLTSFDSFFQYHCDNIYNVFLHNALSIFESYFTDKKQSNVKNLLR